MKHQCLSCRDHASIFNSYKAWTMFGSVMNAKLRSMYSPDEIRAVINGPEDEIIQTQKASILDSSGKLTPAIFEMRRIELLDIIRNISNNTPLIDQIILDAQRTTERIDGGATSSDRPYPYSNKIVSYFSTDDIYRKDVLSTFIVNFVGSYLIQKYGNDAEL